MKVGQRKSRLDADEKATKMLEQTLRVGSVNVSFFDDVAVVAVVVVVVVDLQTIINRGEPSCDRYSTAF